MQERKKNLRLSLVHCTKPNSPVLGAHEFSEFSGSSSGVHDRYSSRHFYRDRALSIVSSRVVLRTAQFTSGKTHAIKYLRRSWKHFSHFNFGNNSRRPGCSTLNRIPRTNRRLKLTTIDRERRSRRSGHSSRQRRLLVD